MKQSFPYHIFFILAFCSCNHKKNNIPTIDSSEFRISVDTSNLPKSYDTFILVSSAQLSIYKTVNINNISFQLVKNADGDTSFLQTLDKSFITPEGYHVEMSSVQIEKAYRDKLIKEPGWGYYVELPSKWNLRFEIGESTTDHPPADTNIVTAIFKRRR